MVSPELLPNPDCRHQNSLLHDNFLISVLLLINPQPASTMLVIPNINIKRKVSLVLSFEHVHSRFQETYLYSNLSQALAESQRMRSDCTGHATSS